MSTEMASRSAPVPRPEDMSRLRQLIMGFRITQMIHVAAKLELADHLARKPQTEQAELAPLVGAEAVPLHRLLRALASIGVFAESRRQRLRNDADGRAAAARPAGLVAKHGHALR